MDYGLNKQLITDYIKDNNLTKIDFCRQCKISVSTLNRILSGKDFYLNQLFKIAKAMRLSLTDLFG